ncbi:MAG: CPBP family intramembrane glutamic endopeptidase [Mycobacterium sp.]
MYATKNRLNQVLTAPAMLAVWGAAATALTAWRVQGYQLGFSVAVTAVAAVAAGVLAVLIVRRPLPGNRIRVLAYVCAVAATQVDGVFNAVVAMTTGLPYVPRNLGVGALLGEVLGAAALSVWTFFLVRAWMIDQLPRRSDTRSRFHRVSVGCAAATAALLVLFASNIAYNTLVVAFAVPDVDYPMFARGAGQWLVLGLSLALAGVAEEPVFVGVALLLWPRLAGRTAVAVWVLTSLARAGIHLYYAAGAGAATGAAVILVILWCAAWSGFNLFLVYRTRRLWPVMLAHGLQNSIGFAAALSISYVSFADQLLLSGATGLIMGTVLFLVSGSVCFLVLGVRRIWFGRTHTDQLNGKNCPLIQTPQWPPEPQSHHTIG